jgi:hypothetical protein
MAAGGPGHVAQHILDMVELDLSGKLCIFCDLSLFSCPLY